MTTDIQTTLPADGAVVDIPLNKLKHSPKNARKTPHGEAAIEALAASIAAKGVLQPPVVEPELDEAGAATGFYLVTFGEGRRLALRLLARRKAIKKTHPVRCIVDLSHDPHEISLDENITRTGMHPADQFEAFQRLAEERGYGPEEIAARFGVTPTVVRQRLKLAAVSPKLIQAYRDEAMTLEQLMAFAVSDDHDRQEAVWEGLGWNKGPGLIRRALTETQVPANDRRALFVGSEAYAAAGGHIVRDLFSEDEGGWFADPALLDRLVADKLAEIAGEVREREGWKWAEAVDRFSGIDHRRVYPRPVERDADEQARMAALAEEYDALVETWQHEEPPAEIEARLAEIDAALQAFGDGEAYDPEEVARGGVFVGLDADGQVRVERGFIRSEDEPAPEPEPVLEGDEAASSRQEQPEALEPEEEDEPGEAGLAPLSDRLVADLTAHRTAGLRDTLAGHPDLALLALIHVLALKTFYQGYDLGSCLEIEVRSQGLRQQAPGIDEGTACRNMEARHATWAGQLPKSPGDLWAAILMLADTDRMALMAHCVSLTVNAVRGVERRTRALAHADVLATALDLDMTTYWTPSAASYFERVSKSHILEAVREGTSVEAAERMVGLKKGPMVEVAEEALAGRGWLPGLLRTIPAETLDMASGGVEASAEPEPHAVAAE